MRSNSFSYLFIAILFLNYAALIANTNVLLSETKESEIQNSGLDNESETVQTNKGMRQSGITQKTPFSEILQAGGQPLTSHTPPSTPPSGYLEDYVDAVTDNHSPANNGTIDDWTQMQATDGTYSNLTEEFYNGDLNTSWYSPSAYENNNGWSNPQRIYVSDDNRASFNNDNENVVLYNFTLPDLSSYTIVGIEVQLEGYESGSTSVDIALLWNARSQATSEKRIYLSSSEQYRAVGGAEDTWGRTWSVADFINANFGVKLTGQVGFSDTGYVDHVQVKIYYQEEGYEFDREFSFEDVAVYDDGLELAIKAGQISNESLQVDMWNGSSSSWFNILNINDIDDYTWKNVSLASYLPFSGADLHFRFVDTTLLGDSYSNTWQIDSILIRYHLLSCYFLNRKNITIDHTQVTGSLTNFPVLIDFYDTDLHDDAQGDGDDIIFTTSGGVKLAHQLEMFNSTYNSTHAHLIAWIEVPNLSSTTDTVISMYYGNSTIVNQEHPRATWKNDFGAVWHLGEIVTDEVFTANAHNDSTSNKYHGNQDGNDDSSGLIGKGQAFDGTDDLINVTADKNLDLSADVTLSGWFKLTNTHSSASSTSLLIMEKFLDSENNMHIVLAGTDYEGVDVQAGALVFKVETDNDGWTYSYKWTQQTTWTADTWYYFACILDANNPDNNKIYINGVDDTSWDDETLAGSPDLAYNVDWGIGGGLAETLLLPAGEAWFDGVLDEIRVATTIRTTGWIVTEYNNQINPVNFYTSGLEEHMEDLDPPEIVAFGVHDPGDGQPAFWAQVTDDFSGVASVNITLNGAEYEMAVNGSGYWIYQPPVVNFNDSFSYFVNSSDFEGRLTSTAMNNCRFDKDKVTPTVDQWKYFPEIGSYGTFNANITEAWGIIDTVIVNVTKMNGSPTALSALMRPTPSGYINDTIDTLERGIIEFVIIVNDTVGNTITSTSHLGFVGANDAPIAGNLTLSPNPVHSNETLQLTYDFYDPNHDAETGTEICWYKNGLLQPEHNDTTTISPPYLFKGDYWNVTVRPKDWKDFGSLETSNLVTVLNSQPVVSNIRFTFEHVKITPFDDNRDFMLEDEPLTLTYSFFDADPTDTDESTINWYLNNETQPQYTNWTTIPASITIPGEVWQVEIIPHDGEEASAPILTKQMTIESRPDIHGYGFNSHSTTEGVYDIWIQAGDELRTIDEVKYNITVNGLLIDGLPYNHRESVYSMNGTGHWVLKGFDLLEILRSLPNYFETQFIDLLNTIVTIKVRVFTKVSYESTIYTVERALQFDFTLTDAAPPRVINAGVEWMEPNPTNMTFWATLNEYGLGIDEVLLFYEFRPMSAQTKAADLSHGSLLMIFNGTHYVVTVDFTSDQNYNILFQLSVSDRAGNINPNAYPEGMIADRIQFTLPSSTDLGPFLVLFVIVIVIIGIGAVVAIRKFGKTEIIGLDIDKVMEISQQIPKEEIKKAITGHTLGIIISLFDQLHGPIPIYVEPSLLRDNFDKLIELSDRAFSAVRFVDDFEREIFTAFEFEFDVLTTSISYGFSLERPEARGGAENISLNIVIHKPYDVLITKFADAYTDEVHQIHILMNRGTAEKEKIAKLVSSIRETITAIILAYEELYGSVEEFEPDKQEANVSL